MQKLSAATSVISAAHKAQNFANTTVETARFEVLKEPLGFIKILQFVMALLAFSIACNGDSFVEFTVNCTPSSVTVSPGTTTLSPGFVRYRAYYSYPYDLTKASFTPIIINSCTNPTPLDQTALTTRSFSISSSASFFVFTGVTAFLYAFAFGIIYIFFKHKYNNILFFPLIDFGCTVIFTIFWFAGSIAWAKAVSDIQNYTSQDTIFFTSLAKACARNGCSFKESATYANIIVSCILGFGNLILWIGDCWFVLKETTWYKTRKQIQEQARNTTNNPISANDVTITAHYDPNNKF